MIERLTQWMLAWAVTPYGAWALFFLAIAESSVFPIPPDVLLIALGVANPERAIWFGAVCTAGSVLGGMLGYLIGLLGGRPVLYRLFNQAKVARVEAIYNRFDAWATAIAGLSPIPYKVFTIAGGVFKIRFKVFVLASLGARGLRFMTEGVLLSLYGEQVARFLKSYFDVAALALVVVAVLGFLAVGWIGKLHATRAGKES